MGWMPWGSSGMDAPSGFWGYTWYETIFYDEQLYFHTGTGVVKMRGVRGRGPHWQVSPFTVRYTQTNPFILQYSQGLPLLSLRHWILGQSQRIASWHQRRHSLSSAYGDSRHRHVWTCYHIHVLFSSPCLCDHYYSLRNGRKRGGDVRAIGRGTFSWDRKSTGFNSKFVYVRTVRYNSQNQVNYY